MDNFKSDSIEETITTVPDKLYNESLDESPLFQNENSSDSDATVEYSIEQSQLDDVTNIESAEEDNTENPEIIAEKSMNGHLSVETDPSDDESNNVSNVSSTFENVNLEKDLMNEENMEVNELLLEVPSQEEKSLNCSTDTENGMASSFVDSLLNKIRRKNSDSSGSEVSKQRLLSDSEEDLLVEVDAPIRYIKSSNPNCLPTPIVRNPRSTSAFVNTEEEYRKAVAKHKAKTTLMQEPKTPLFPQSEVPRMQPPSRSIQRPRTLAEKRQIINNNVKFLMVEQEAKIYRQVQRKNDNLELNFTLLDSMVRFDIPIQPGPFKVLTWLRTRGSNFNSQYLNINDERFKLNGSRGNHRAKFLTAKPSDPLPKYQTTTLRSTRCCKGGRISKSYVKTLWNLESIRRFVLNDSSDSFKRLDTKYLENQLVSIKPRPLSKKIEFINTNRKVLINDEDGAFLGNFTKFKMPQVKLEVEITPKISLDPTVKKYLNEILPHNDLDENWCEFALTPLAGNKEENEPTQRKSFEFIIPYQESKNEILVREVIRSKEDNELLRILYDNEEDPEEDMEWTFCKDADENDEIVEIIKDLTNSVFINLNDDLFTKDDPHDRTTSSLISPIKSKEAIDELSTLVRPDDQTSKRLWMELRRLNANVYMSESSIIENETDMRRNATAHLGKVERDLRPTVIVTESDTVLLGEKETRRTKRVPKKFDDYENSMTKGITSESDNEEPVAKKRKSSEIDGDLSFKGRRPSVLQQSYEDLKSIKQEVNKMLHVSVDVRRMDEVDNLEVWCMVHKLYKCYCKRHFPIERMNNITAVVEKKTIESDKPSLKSLLMAPATNFTALNSLKKQAETLSEPTTPAEPEEALEDDGFSRRVLPVQIEPKRVKPLATAIFKNSDGLPKIEIVNLCDLINGGIGPIFINVYDDKSMRLNPILRSVLNNKSAIIYFDGSGFFIDKQRVNVNKLDFSALSDELDYPIFIIQAKDEFPSPVSSTMKDSYVKVLFQADSAESIRIRDKTDLNELTEIIESILRNVRKKIEAKIEGEPSELVKEQLSRLTRDRSRSTSVSSNHSSPLSFQGTKLREAPSPGLTTPIMQEFNQIFSSRMKRLVGLISSNTLGLNPSNEMINKFYIYQWSLMLKSFEEQMIQIWQIRFESETGEGYHMLALTASREPPEIEHAEKKNIVNIRKLKMSDDITELTRFLLLRVEKPSMKNMTILLYGCKGYFRICGILNSKEHFLNGFVAKPTRATHPRIAAKIQKIYHIWYASRKARARRLFEQFKKKENQKISGRDAEGKKPGSGSAEFKWFLFNVTNDFSDIYIKSWSRYLSYKVIMEVITRAKTLNRAVALTAGAKATWPKIFALPGAPLKFKDHNSMTDNFLIFGPYLRNSNSNLLLMQNVDGDLMLRDEYEKRNNIQRSTRTRCLWIYANTLQCLNDADPYPIKLMWRCDENRSKTSSNARSKPTNMEIASIVGGFNGEENETEEQE